MKRLILLLAGIAISFNTFAQDEEISREWTSFVQTADVSFLKKKVKFKVQASAKVTTSDSSSWAGIFVRIDNKNGEDGFFDNMGDRPIRASTWKTYTIEGFMDDQSDKINFGGLGVNNGKFYFDKFEFFFENEKGEMQKANIVNAGFESPVVSNPIPGWQEGIRKSKPVRVKEFTIQTTEDRVEGKFAIVLEGRGIARDSSYLLNATKGFTPQIGILVSMLNNLSKRVEDAVSGLNERELDHYLDDKANSIGALIMHLAAAEAYYQVYTFENRGFNDEENKKWGVALDLGEAGKSIRGHDAKYYLEIYLSLIHI